MKSTRKDAEFSYRFLETGQYDTPPGVQTNVLYFFPYLDSVETLYGPVAASLPTVQYTYRTAPQDYQLAGSLPGSVLERWANVVEQEATYSGFGQDAPPLAVYFLYQNADYGSQEDTLQGFRTVQSCAEAACSGSGWSRKEVFNFEARPFAANDAMLTGRLRQHDVYQQGGAQVTKTVNTWAILNGTGVSPYVQQPILTEAVQTDYRGATLATRTKYVYDSYGNQTEVREFGNRLGAGDAPLADVGAVPGQRQREQQQMAGPFALAGDLVERATTTLPAAIPAPRRRAGC